LEDRQLITDKLYTYCWGVDHDDADTWISTFTDDVHFEFGEVKIDGKEDLKTWISTEVIGTLLHMRHIITNTIIEFEGEDKAKSKSYWSFNSGFNGHEDEGVTDRGEGKYYFRWRKEDGEWKAYELIAEPVWWTGYNVE
jgi:hypothetical protein